MPLSNSGATIQDTAAPVRSGGTEDVIATNVKTENTAIKIRSPNLARRPWFLVRGRYE